MADLPLPFEPSLVEKSMAWLYSVGPVIYNIDPMNHAMWGHNAGTVAYVVNDVVARELVALYEEEMSTDAQVYRSWEVTIPIKLRRERGVKCYIPWRMYGEHGGIANPEHKKSRMRAWHEADVLAGPLHFLPAYARGSKALFLVRRLRGRARGFYRFFAGKYFDRWTAWWRAKENRLLKLRLAVSRLI
jgi:hypothetical protein